MTHPKWLKDAVFYEIYPNSFMDSNGDGYGDFKGITSKLDYIKSLGCNAIWLNPHYESEFMDGGYDVVDYFKVSKRFGTEADFDEMLNECHKRGIKLVCDLVPGHTSEMNKDFLRSAENTPNELSNRFIWTNDVWNAPQGYRLIMGRHNRNGAYMVNFFATQPALNYGFKDITHPEWQMPYTHPDCLKTREWLKSVMRFWYKRGVDGFRVDMADSLVKGDDDKTATIELWQDITNEFKRDFPETALISEWSSPRSIKAGFDADFMLDHHGNAYNVLVRREEEPNQFSYFNANGKGDAKLFADLLMQWFTANENKGYIGWITCNHDTPRLSPFYTQEQLKLIYATLFTMAGVPFLYYGDEIGISYKNGMPSVECGFARTGTRTPMQWTSGTNAGFSTASKDNLFLPVEQTPNVAEQEKDPNSLLNVTRKIIAFRHGEEDLKGFDFEILHAQGSTPLVYRRGKLLVAVNPLSSEQKVSGLKVRTCDCAFNIGKCATLSGETLTVPPMSFTVLRIK